MIIYVYTVTDIAWEEGGTECYVDEDVKLYANKPSKANSQDFEKQSWCQCRAEEKHVANCVTRKGRPSDTCHKLPLPQLQCRITSARFWLVFGGLGDHWSIFCIKNLHRLARNVWKRTWRHRILDSVARTRAWSREQSAFRHTCLKPATWNARTVNIYTTPLQCRQTCDHAAKTSKTKQDKRDLGKALHSSHQVIIAMNPFLSWEGCYATCKEAMKAEGAECSATACLATPKDCQHRHHFEGMTRMTLRIQHFCFAVLYRNAFQKGSPRILA